MWNGRKCAAMAIAAIGCAVAAAAPASAQYYGAADSFGDDGHAGVHSHGSPYAARGLAGYGPSGDYGFGYRRAYGAALGADRNDSSTGYGYYGSAPSYSYGGYPFYGRAHDHGSRRSARRVLGDGYGLGDRRPYDHAFGAAQHRDFTAPPAQDKIMYRNQNLKLAPAN
jgi:hypothetical protein